MKRLVYCRYGPSSPSERRFLSDEEPTLETLDFTIRIYSYLTYFDLYLYSAYAAHYVYFNIYIYMYITVFLNLIKKIHKQNTKENHDPYQIYIQS